MENTLAALCKCSVRGVLLNRAFSHSCQRSAAAKTHYVVLGLTPAATQADVKAAYYKLSKVYHPDLQNKDNAAAVEENLHKFRQLAAAYEVLGNVKLRKLYDKGMTHVSSGTTRSMRWKPPEDDDPTLNFYRSRDLKSRPPPPTANTPLYDFDEWSKQHYGATFARDQHLKRKQQYRDTSAASASNDVKVERVLIVMGVLTLTIMIINSDMHNHDVPAESAPAPPPLPQNT